MRQTSINFKSKRLTLEGVLTVPQEQPGPFPAAVLCHPHPLFGGSMDNAVVMAIARALDAAGIATLRFNFRGVGNSEGTFSKGAKEQQDLRSALELLRQWPGIDAKRLALVGYSFGAQVILQGLGNYKKAKALALLSPPLPSFDGSPVGKSSQSKLFMVGDSDRLADPARLEQAVANLASPVEFRVVPKADHSWKDHEQEAAQGIAHFLGEAL